MGEPNPNSKSRKNLEIPLENRDTALLSCTSSLVTTQASEVEEKPKEEDEEELRRLLLPNVDELPETPPSAVEANFATFFLPGKV